MEHENYLYANSNTAWKEQVLVQDLDPLLSN